MSDKEIKQDEVLDLDQEVESQVDEAKASFGVDAEVPEPTGKEATPPGDKPEAGDKKKKLTKVAAIQKISQEVKGMNKEQFEKVYEAMLAALEGKEVVSEDKDEETTAVSVRELRQIKAGDVNVAEDVAAMFSGEDLSEEFTTKASTIFEAAVVSKVNELLETVTVDLEAEMEVAKDEIAEDMAGKLDSYLEYVAEEWMKENELAVEQGIRAEIQENFMKGLKDLFVENYIEVPEEKVDLVDELAGKVEELEQSINEEMEKSIDLKKELTEAKVEIILGKVSDGLTESQAIKLASLAEGVEFENEESYVEKLETLKSNYFKSDEVVTEETAIDDEPLEIDEDAEAKIDPGMSAYMSAISKSIKK
jgi:HAMP domain-containing protein